MTSLTPLELKTWLEWAGARLIAMPGRRPGPADIKVIWPEYSQDKFQVLDHRPGLSIHAAAPSNQEIPIVDEILSLPSVCSLHKPRRVLHIRALVHPLNGRYIYTWTRVAEKLESNRETVRYWHKKGLQEVCDKADRGKVCHISAFLQSALQAYEARANLP